MHEMCDLRQAVLPRPVGPTARRLRTRLLLLSAIGLGIAASACGDAEITEPVVRADSMVASIEMLPSHRALSFIGMTDRMRARSLAADGTLLQGSMGNAHLFSWQSDAPEVVTVDQLGVVTAVGEGTARVSATSAGVTGTATVTVRDAVRLGWTYRLDGTPGALAIGDDGTIYVAAHATLHALAPGGQDRWGVYTGGQIVSAPAIAPDGTLYAGTAGSRGSLMAVHRSGAELWALDDLGWITTSPAIGSDGTVYAASRDSTLYAVDPAGHKRWEFKGHGSFTSSPALAQDGTIVVGAEDGRLYAVGPDGSERWTFPAEGIIRSSPAIALDGTIYFGAQDQHLYALTPDGELKWRLPLPLGREASSSPAIGLDGTVYIGGDGLHAVDPSGALRWTYPGPNPGSGTEGFYWTPIVAGDGTIYAGGRHLYALAPDGTLKWDHPIGRRPYSSPLIGLDGTVLATSSDSTQVGRLHAIVELDGSNGGFEGAPWPKARGDRGNTGRAGGP